MRSIQNSYISIHSSVPSNAVIQDCREQAAATEVINDESL